MRSRGARGGTPTNRDRFAEEIARACRDESLTPLGPPSVQLEVGDHDGRIPESPEELLAPLARAGADMFDASSHRHWELVFAELPMRLAGCVKRITTCRP